jgi:hypothetical protein
MDFNEALPTRAPDEWVQSIKSVFGIVVAVVVVV